MKASRREFLKTFCVSGAVVVAAPACFAGQSTDKPMLVDDLFAGKLGPFVKINADNSIEIGAPVPDMGTGVETSLPMLIAEELDADWEHVTVRRLYCGVVKGAKNTNFEKYTSQGSGGSGSIRRSWKILRECGAMARHLIVSAAADELKIDSAKIITEKSHVLLGNGSRKIPYAYFFERALQQNLSDMKMEELSYGGDNVMTIGFPSSPERLRTKKTSEFKVIGSGQKQKNGHAIVTGQEAYGLDLNIEGQLYAVIARCPYIDGAVKSYDGKEALKVDGVVAVVEVPNLADEGSNNKLNSPGVAVVATSQWSAMKACKKLKIVWDEGARTHENNAWYVDNARQKLNGPEKRLDYTSGDVEAAFERAEKTYSQEYITPYWGHFNMEPMNAAAHVMADKCVVKLSHQAPSFAAMDIANYTGLAFEQIEVVYGRVGCGLGRKWSWDNLVEALYLSQQTGKAVKVFWSREDDTQNDFFNPHSVVAIDAALDDKDKIIGWKTVGASQWRPRLKGFPVGLIENVRHESIDTGSRLPTGAWRGPGNNVAGFITEGMLNKVARETQQDPLKMRLDLLGEDRIYKNLDWLPFGEEKDKKLSSKKMKDVLLLAAKQADWKHTKLPQNWGRGIASHFTFGSYAAFVVDVSYSKEKGLVFERVFGAADCGIVVNRLGALAQIEGGIHDALSTIIHQEMIVEEGRIISDNFDQIPLMRIDEAPKSINIEFIDSSDEPWGLGEIALPAVIPAAIAAITDATGIEITRLPLGEQLSISRS